MNHFSSSDEEDDDNSDNNSMLNLDSPIVIFPDKIKNQNMSQNKSCIEPLKIPKLDLTGVKAKYHNIKNIQISEAKNVVKKHVILRIIIFCTIVDIYFIKGINIIFYFC